MKRFAPLFAMMLAAVFAIAADAPSPLQMNQKDPSKAPKIYVIPIGLDGHGQMGTDIRLSAFEKVVKDVNEKKPDLIIFVMESSDGKTGKAYLGNDDRSERGQMDFEDARKMIDLLKADLGTIPQVMWVKDSVGFSTALALAWPDLYMSSKARLWGMDRVREQYERTSDDEVRKKYMAAWTGIVNGFLRRGGYPSELGLAMMRPELLLSVSWNGRNLTWRSDTKGTFLVEGDTQAVANFDAKTAEDLGLCDGIADSIEDLMFLLGYREWDDSLGKNNQDGVKIVGDYIAEWRKAYTKSIESFGEYEKNVAASKFTAAKTALERVRDAMKKYPALEFRWRIQGRPGLDDVEKILLQLKEQSRSAPKNK